MAHFGIQNKLIKANTEYSNYHVKMGTIMTEGFQVGNGLEQGDGLALKLFKHCIWNT
jgi:hypothetical protein